MSRVVLVGITRLVVGALVVGAGAPTLGAQYFGRNKIQYHDFKFAVLETEHFDVYFYPIERAAASQAGRVAERWHARYTRLLNHRLTGRQPVILYASHPEFEQTNAVSAARKTWMELKSKGAGP